MLWPILVIGQQRQFMLLYPFQRLPQHNLIIWIFGSILFISRSTPDSIGQAEIARNLYIPFPSGLASFGRSQCRIDMSRCLGAMSILLSPIGSPRRSRGRIFLVDPDRVEDGVAWSVVSATQLCTAVYMFGKHFSRCPVWRLNFQNVSLTSETQNVLVVFKNSWKQRFQGSTS